MEEQKIIEKNKQEVTDIVAQVLDKGANYIIKSMPVNEHIKSILKDVKESLDKKDFKEVLKTAVGSSITEGASMFGIGDEGLQKLDVMVNTAFEGGIVGSVSLCVEMLEKVKKSGNLFCNYIEDFFIKLKVFVGSRSFKSKIYACIRKCKDKVENFKALCDSWYKAYDNFSVSELKQIAGQIEKMKKKVSFDLKCIDQNNMIQNIMELIDVKKDKLSATQFDICSQLERL